MVGHAHAADPPGHVEKLGTIFQEVLTALACASSWTKAEIGRARSSTPLARHDRAARRGLPAGFATEHARRLVRDPHGLAPAGRESGNWTRDCTGDREGRYDRIIRIRRIEVKPPRGGCPVRDGSRTPRRSSSGGARSPRAPAGEFAWIVAHAGRRLRARNAAVRPVMSTAGRRDAPGRAAAWRPRHRLRPPRGVPRSSRQRRDSRARASSKSRRLAQVHAAHRPGRNSPDRGSVRSAPLRRWRHRRRHGTTRAVPWPACGVA